MQQQRPRQSRDTCASAGVPQSANRRRDPLSGITGSVRIIDSSAKNWYDGLLVSVGYNFNVSYALSKTFDYSADDQLETATRTSKSIS